MAVPIVMPKLGMVMSEGTVARWAKAAGEAVNRGEVIAEIETEKINYELEATDDGILHHVVDEGASVLVDGVVAYLLAEGEEAPAAPPPPAAPAPVAAPPRRRSRAARRSAAGGEVRSTPGARKTGFPARSRAQRRHAHRTRRQGGGSRCTRARREEGKKPPRRPAVAPLPPGSARRSPDHAAVGHTQIHRRPHAPEHSRHGPALVQRRSRRDRRPGDEEEGQRGRRDDLDRPRPDEGVRRRDQTTAGAQQRNGRRQHPLLRRGKHRRGRLPKGGADRAGGQRRGRQESRRPLARDYRYGR